MIFPFFGFRDWIFAINIAVAALSALFLALWIDLPRPYWAVATVFITTQSLAGATRSKAAYRVYGTVLGAVATVIMVPNLIDAPELLSAAIALWVAFCLYFSLLDRTPKSYVLMLGGYTAAFVGFPSVADPGSIFDTAVARAEEITLGILCASLVSSVVLPQSVAPLIRSRLDQWFRDARQWSAAVFNRNRTDNGQAQRLRLACDAIAFDALVTPLRYDMSGAKRSAEAMATLRQHMLMFLPIVAAIADRIAALESAQALSIDVRRRLADMAAWIASGTTEPITAHNLRLAIADLDPVLGRKPRWSDLVMASLVARLEDFIDLRQDARALQRHIVDGTPVRETLAFRYTADARTVRHRDRGLALLSAVAAFLAIALSASIWIATAWPDGAFAPTEAAVACSFFAVQDDPAPQIIGLMKAAIVGTVGAALYLFVVLPLATNAEMVALALAPGMIACGLLMTQPRTALFGLGTGAVGFTLLALQDRYSGDFATFTNGAIAAIVGLWTAAMVTRLVRSVGGAWSARRLRRINRRDLTQAALKQGTADGLELAALMLDRIGLIAPRLASLPSEDAEWTRELLTEVRIGIAVVELRRVRTNLPPKEAAAFDRVLSAVAAHFQTDTIHVPAKVLALIDAALNAVVALEAGSLRRTGLLGLTDLRRGLFPNAAPYRPALETELAA
ncbi:FUSC family protein [Mesorhizobium sp. B3-1-7]|uniref:FUSC family protein n=1 Tax=Mesorhizobium sp. B3-1-7 TaxID=2589894 RepID=UPI001127C1C3|nr:FUSC family protein [Mesorhizobium sp. B3-1-7]TPI44938.1 FUSC family protein [Mesorhizobium sp. B3-1-7]